MRISAATPRLASLVLELGCCPFWYPGYLAGAEWSRAEMRWPPGPGSTQAVVNRASFQIQRQSARCSNNLQQNSRVRVRGDVTVGKLTKISRQVLALRLVTHEP